jgi:tetratricopeptide (TPR) repeat protein
MADTIPFVIELYKRFDAMREMDRFARVVALLNWLDAADKLPALPSSVEPRRIDQPNACFLSQVGFSGGDIQRFELTSQDRVGRVRPGCYSKTHVLFLDEGQDVVIDMTSSHFDAFLRLEDSRGRKLAEDDDSGGGLNARIAFRARQAGAYRIVATTFEAGKTGAYHLQIWDSASPATWIGKTVLIKRPGVKFGHTDGSGKQIYLGTLEQPAYVVLNEDAGWIQVEQGKVRGWLDKSDAVDFESALGYFGQALQKGSGQAWALACRGTVRERRGELELALQDFERAAQLSPDSWRSDRDRVKSALQQ